MNTYFADLHIHTALSPCASEEMTPPAIVSAALARGLDLIAICDHNAAANAGAALLASDERVAVFSGIEITTREEVHVLGLFPGPISALAAGEEVLDTLPVGDAAYRRRFGWQRILDAEGRVAALEDRMLAVATQLDLAAAISLIHRHSGVAVAAHLNRPSFSVLSQLGVFPADAGFDAVEVFVPCGGETTGSDLAPYVGLGLPVLASSDAHYLADIGRARTACTMAAATFDEFVLALRGEAGRGVRVA